MTDGVIDFSLQKSQVVYKVYKHSSTTTRAQALILLRDAKAAY